MCHWVFVEMYCSVHRQNLAIWFIIYVSPARSRKTRLNRTTETKKKLWSASRSPNTPFVNSSKSNTVCGIFSILWMTFFCRQGVFRSAVIYETTSLPCVTYLSMSPGLAQGSLSGLPGVSDGTSLSAWGCVCVTCELMSVCVLRKNMQYTFHIAHSLQWAAVNSITHCVSICVGSLGVIFLSPWSKVCPQVKLSYCIPHTQAHTFSL